MKTNIKSSYIILLIFIFSSCRDSFRNLIERDKIILLDENTCKVISYYPVVHIKNNDSVVSSLNINLKDINRMERYVDDCSGFFTPENLNKKKEIIGDYKILFESDSLLNIEFSVNSKYFSKTEYHSVFIDLVKGELIEGSRIIPNIDRSKLYPYVKRFVDSTGIDINLKAYEKDSKYSIMFGKTKSEFVLYLGKEGEFGGYYKITVPLKDIVD